MIVVPNKGLKNIEFGMGLMCLSFPAMSNGQLILLRGDFGESFQFERPVRQLVVQRFWLTVILAIATIMIVWALAIPIGVYSASHQYSFGDQVLRHLVHWARGPWVPAGPIDSLRCLADYGN